MADGIKISEMNESVEVDESTYIPIIQKSENRKYNLNKLMNNYSTEERVVGKWIDRKPIYRRCYQYDGETSYNQNLVIDSSLKPSAIEHLIDCRLNYYKQIISTHVPLPRDIVVPRFNEQNNAVPKIHITEEDGLYISVNQPSYYHNFTIIIEYTKNTEV